MRLSPRPLRAASLIAGVAMILAAASPAFARYAAGQASDVTRQLSGSWINPRGTVTVRAGPCQDGLCGWVSRADGQAQQDAHDAGISNLVGIELLQGYRRTGATRWTGRVYVPDMGGTYYSTIQQLDADRLKISGCILGGLLCKSQIWRRG